MKGQKMIKPRLVHSGSTFLRKQTVGAVSLKKGMAVAMNDGWCGYVHLIDGDSVICIQNGERPNDWLKGYRGFSRRLMSINGTKAIVDWKSATASRSTVNREQRSSAAVVDLERARLEREWQSAPD